ncbi:MAG: hypothetical protein ACPGJE_02260, partial [Wenzhouxiangellaceae bacterium]
CVREQSHRQRRPGEKTEVLRLVPIIVEPRNQRDQQKFEHTLHGNQSPETGPEPPSTAVTRDSIKYRHQPCPHRGREGRENDADDRKTFLNRE